MVSTENTVLTTTVSSVSDDHGVDLKETLKIYSPPSSWVVVVVVGASALGDEVFSIAIHNIFWACENVLIGALTCWLV